MNLPSAGMALIAYPITGNEPRVSWDRVVIAPVVTRAADDRVPDQGGYQIVVPHVGDPRGLKPEVVVQRHFHLSHAQNHPCQRRSFSRGGHDYH